MGAVITLTTDFGLADGYVAAVKGVILGINPAAQLVDVTHLVKPQDIAGAAFLLDTVWRHFPPGTIHLIIVDPGVGTARKAIILPTPEAYFIAPDNGVLTYVIRHYQASGQPVAGIALTNAGFWRQPVSPTFHGRDIFAPVAAHLSLGRPPADFGAAITSFTTLPLPRPYAAPDGSLVGHIIHIDGFGNLITNIRGEDLPAGKAIRVEVGDRVLNGLSLTYAEGEELIALVGSSGYLEIARRDGSAAALLAARVGHELIVKISSSM